MDIYFKNIASIYFPHKWERDPYVQIFIALKLFVLQAPRWQMGSDGAAQGGRGSAQQGLVWTMSFQIHEHFSLQGSQDSGQHHAHFTDEKNGAQQV